MVCEAVKFGENRYGERGSRYFEGLKIGDIFEHCPARTITETDNIWFTHLTMNTRPLHFGSEYTPPPTIRAQS